MGSLRRGISRAVATAVSFAAVGACGGLPLSVGEPAELPAAWRPRPGERHGLPSTPWTDAEERACAAAARVGLREMIAFFEVRPERVLEQGENAIEAFLDTRYAASDPELAADAKRWAARCAEAVAREWLERPSDPGAPDDWSSVVVLAGYAARALGEDHPQTRALVLRANAVAPASIRDALGESVARTLAGDPDIDTVYGLVMWSISLLDAAAVSGLILPDDASDVLDQTLAHLAAHPFPSARTYPDGANDWTFYDHAYTATHIGYVPTGYGRYRLKVADAPWLYAFVRENFYPVLAMGELDLVAEFVDLLRQYGCTPANDAQCRDGTRYLLALFERAGGSWIAHRESYEVGEPVSDYDLLHKPWTAVAGVRARKPQVAESHGYRWHFERWLGRSP